MSAVASLHTSWSTRFIFAVQKRSEFQKCKSSVHYSNLLFGQPNFWSLIWLKLQIYTVLNFDHVDWHWFHCTSFKLLQNTWFRIAKLILYRWWLLYWWRQFVMKLDHNTILICEIKTYLGSHIVTGADLFTAMELICFKYCIFLDIQTYHRL